MSSKDRRAAREALRALAKSVVVLAVLCACSLLGGTAFAADSSEFWPDLEGFVSLGPRARIYTNFAYAEGKESATQSRDITAAFDLSIRRVLQRSVMPVDWQRSRLLWARAGYTRVDKADNGARGTPEDRLFLQFLAKLGLPADVWLETRARTEFRWIGQEYSNRYRVRVDATREFEVSGLTVVPYLRAECFYDTRYDGWARTLYQAGPEITVNERFRIEPYLALQVDRLPDDESLTAIGITGKFYF